MSADRFGIVNDPDDETTAVLLYDGEPIGTIERQPDTMTGPYFLTAGLTIRDNIFDPRRREVGIGGTTRLTLGWSAYAAWKNRVGLSSSEDER